MTKITISKIASISSGMTFRDRVENSVSGDCMVIQPKDIDKDTLEIQQTAHKIVSKFSVSQEKQLLSNGDILFAAKGNVNYAVTFKGEHKAVATALFFIIRLRPECGFLPDFVAWYLNQSPIQSELHGSKAGTSVSNVNLDSLKSLEIPQISISAQHRYLNIHRLWQDERETTLKILKMKETMYKNLALREITLPEPEPYSDVYADMYGYVHLSMNHKMKVTLREPILPKGSTTPTTEIIGLFINLHPKQRIFDITSTKKEGYLAAGEWEFLEFKNLNVWNDGPTTQLKHEKYINIIDHTIIAKIEVI